MLGVLRNRDQSAIPAAASRPPDCPLFRIPYTGIVTASEHEIRISFPHLANIEDPRNNVNVDQRRKLWIDYLDIVGPFSGDEEPPESYKSLFVCGHARGKHDESCTRNVLRNIAARAWRRPVTESELDKLLGVSALARKQGESVEEGVRAAVQAILVSPHFLFRIERERAPPGKGAYQISEHELASRLSYFLWSTMPDDDLLRLAATKQLRVPGVLEQQVKRMIADPKSEALIEGFAAQWLQLRNLDRAKPDV
jgi:hypothetical protein